MIFEYTDPAMARSAASRACASSSKMAAGSCCAFRHRHEGATLRLYLERYEEDPTKFGLDPQLALSPVIRAAHGLARIEEHTGRSPPMW